MAANIPEKAARYAFPDQTNRRTEPDHPAKNGKFPVKSLIVLLLAALASAPLLTLGQSYGPATALPQSPPVGSPSPEPTPAPGPSPATTGPAATSVPLPGLPAGPSLEQNVPLIPETAPSGRGGKPGKSGKSRRRHGAGPNGSASPSASPRDTFGVERDIRLRIRLREAQTRAANEAAVLADWVAAHNTRNDPARREALKVYYNHLYDRIIQIDPSVMELANSRRQAAIGRMYYPRLGDQIPDNPFATPVPAEIEGQNPPPGAEPPLP
jgi:hypothetical protein